MRTAIAPCAAVALPLALVLLAAIPQESQGKGTNGTQAIGVVKAAAGILVPITSSYLEDLRARGESESIKIRVWMHNGDTKLYGCGYYIQVNGYSGGFKSKYFPDIRDHNCGYDVYNMRTTSPGVMYDETLHLDNQQASRVELHADGWQNTFANVICIGFNEGTIAGGPRAFCINNEILKGCNSLTNKWNDINFEWNDIVVTRTSRGAQKIIFREIENLISGFERLGRNLSDVDAMWTLCDRIDLVKGTDRDDNWNCPAVKATLKIYFTPLLTHGPTHETEYSNEDKNPYGCVPRS